MFVQTSTHEGFCLPPLEAMATGGAVVCTDAHGNRDFCVDGDELPDARADRRVGRAARDRAPARRPRAARAARRRAGIATAADYAWERRIDELEATLEAISRTTPVGTAGERG